MVDPRFVAVAADFGKAECIVMSCDYNGWNDAPEEEREWFDQHPEIWSDQARELDTLLHRTTPRFRIRRWR